MDFLNAIDLVSVKPCPLPLGVGLGSWSIFKLLPSWSFFIISKIKPVPLFCHKQVRKFRVRTLNIED